MCKVEVDKEKGIGCEESVNVCLVDAFEMEDEKSVPQHRGMYRVWERCGSE